MQILWKGNEVYAECGMFAGGDRVKLMFPAQKITCVSGHTSGESYEEGRDYIFVPGSSEIRRTENSRIPFLPDSAIHPTENLRLHPDPDANAIANAVGGGYLLFNNRSMLAQNQIDIDYVRAEQNFDSGIDRQLSRLPRTRAMLRQGKPLRVTLIGDSISEGFNATKFTGIAPFAPPYIDQLCSELSRLYHTEITPVNRALARTGIQHAESPENCWRDDRADLLLIAYGMNNISSMPIAEFLTHMQGIIDRAKDAFGETEFLILTFMTGNPQWVPTVPGPDAAYAQGMRDFVAQRGADTALADVQMVWRKFLERKGFYDLSGNGVNHPNDYGHRIYASTVLEVLTGRSYL